MKELWMPRDHKEGVFQINSYNHKNGTTIIRNIVLLIVIMSLCTAVSLLFRHLSMSESNFIMIYFLGILIFSYLASNYFYSFLASVCGVLLYNYIFTEPYFTLQVYDPDHPVTFLVMFTVGFITSMLTIRVKLETQLAEDREGRIKALYYIGKRLLEVKSGEYLAEITAKEIARQFNANVLVQFFDSRGDLCYRYIEGHNVFIDHKERIACMEAYQSGNPCGCGTILISDAKAYYSPVLSQNGVLGVIGISPPSLQTLTNAQIEFLDTIIPQVAVVLERERLYEKQQKTKMQVQQERLRADMLRSISHDLRTPLTGIMGLASTVLDNFDTVSDDVKKNFIHSIYEDADWLNELVENILQTTRFEEGKTKLNVGQEAVEEIVAEAISHVKKRAPLHNIIARMPDEIILLQVDGVLIRQVLVNLLGNAISYSPQGSEIAVSVYRKEDRVIFEVSDSGTGISENDLPHIFDRFYTKNDKSHGTWHGIGIGLSLCKSIIEAHGGEISIRNNEPHGTIASFYIGLKEKT